MQSKALELYETLHGGSPEGQFKASKEWLSRFLKRNDLCTRVITSDGQKIPTDASDLAKKFIDECQVSLAEREYPMFAIGNMDETPMWFDMPSNRSIDFRGVKTVLSKTTGKEKMRYTVVLAALADESKLTPMLIFRGLKNVPKVQFPSGVVVQVSKGGSMNTERLEYWLQNVWKRRKNSLCRQPAVLVLDRHASHLHARIQNQLMREHQTRAIYVPAGMTPLLQPCDLSWNKPFKDAMRRKWKDWLADGIREYTRAGNRKSASYKQVAEWVVECWRSLDAEIIANSFAQCGIVKSTTQSDLMLHSRLAAMLGGEDVSEELSQSSDSESDTTPIAMKSHFQKVMKMTRTCPHCLFIYALAKTKIKQKILFKRMRL